LTRIDEWGEGIWTLLLGLVRSLDVDSEDRLELIVEVGAKVPKVAAKLKEHALPAQQ
jgi:hypothetical protein